MVSINWQMYFRHKQRVINIIHHVVISVKAGLLGPLSLLLQKSLYTKTQQHEDIYNSLAYMQ